MMDGEFLELVQKKFSFLVSDFGFRCVNSSNYMVRYESDKVFLVIHYDVGRSCELDIEIGELNLLYRGKERPFNLREILRLAGVVEEEHAIFQAGTFSVLTKCIAKLSYLLSHYAVELLQHNKFAFQRVSDLRERECDQHALEAKLVKIRKEVEIAWKNNDYDKVAKLYKPVEFYISKAEKKKLIFSEKQLQ